jgi:hypothetical protein
MQMEKLGVPGVFLVSSQFITDAKSAAVDWAMPGLRMVTFPSEKWYKLRGTLDGVQPLADAAVDPVIKALTTALTQQEAKPMQKAKLLLPPIKVIGASYADAVEKLNGLLLEKHMGDGLPLVPPTKDAVDAMLKGTARSRDEVIGKIPMKFGVATIEKIAINAVMAGAKPEYLPVIIAAMEAFCGGEFWHMMGSSGSFTLIVMVNGPIAKEIGINAGIGFLGDCWRANSTIGRSIRLATRNIGHTWPAENDMALVGRPSPHTFFTFAENEEMSPWEPFHVSMGYKKNDSTVTVTKVGSYFGASGQTVGGGAVATWTSQSILDGMAAQMRNKGSGYYAWFHPEAAQALVEAGFGGRSKIQDWLAGKTGVPAKNISVAVTGGVPGYSLIWAFELGTHVTKKISGATLTKAGWTEKGEQSVRRKEE